MPPSSPLHWLPLLAVPLLAVPLLLRALLRAPASEEPWSTRVDVPLALAAGLASALLAGLWLTRFSFRDYPLTASDFEQYCQGVDLLRRGESAGWPAQRSVFAGVLAGWLAGPLGVMDALVVNAFASMALAGATSYLWARSVGGRLAGVCAALGLGAVAPVAALTRTVTFYPTTVAGLLLASAGATAAMRWRTAPALAVAGTGAGVALLVDARGLVWALPAVGIALVAAILGPSSTSRGRALPLRLLALATPLALSWAAGPWAYPEGAVTLENQVAIWAQDALRLSGTEGRVPRTPAGFIWGRSDPRDIPGTLLWLAALPGRLPAVLASNADVERLRHTTVGPWMAPLAVSAMLVVAVHARRRPLAVLALAGTALPFLIALRGATEVLGHPRHVATALAFVPVLFGLAYEGLVTRRGASSSPAAPPAATAARASSPSPRGDGLRVLVGTGAFVLLLLGVIPSWLSPVAGWRVRRGAESEPAAMLEALGGAGMADPRCIAALRRDLADGKGPRLFVGE